MKLPKDILTKRSALALIFSSAAAVSMLTGCGGPNKPVDADVKPAEGDVVCFDKNPHSFSAFLTSDAYSNILTQKPADEWPQLVIKASEMNSPDMHMKTYGYDRAVCKLPVKNTP